MVFNQVFIQMYFTPEEIFFYVLYDFYQVLIRDAPGISERMKTGENLQRWQRLERGERGIHIYQILNDCITEFVLI